MPKAIPWSLAEKEELVKAIKSARYANDTTIHWRDIEREVRFSNRYPALKASNRGHMAYKNFYKFKLKNQDTHERFMAKMKKRELKMKKKKRPTDDDAETSDVNIEELIKKLETHEDE